MYINPFVAGVLATVCVELIVFFAITFMSYIKSNKK